MTAAELQREYRAAQAAGDRMRYVQYWEAWVAASCREGKRPDALRRDSGSASERFAACCAQGPDEHVFWLDAIDHQGRPVFRARHSRALLAQRFAYGLHTGAPLPSHLDVWTTCGEPHCLNGEHLDAGWRPRGNPKALVDDGVLLDRLRECAEQLGHTPTREEYDAWRGQGMHSSAGIGLRFGTWGAAMVRLGLKMMLGPEMKYSKPDAEQGLRELAAELGRLPNTGDWDRSGRSPGRSYFTKHYGTFEGAVRAAGLS